MGIKSAPMGNKFGPFALGLCVCVYVHCRALIRSAEECMRIYIKDKGGNRFIIVL